MDDLSLFFASDRTQKEASEELAYRCNPPFNNSAELNDSSTQEIGILPAFLPPEQDEGFIEYKRELICPTVDRIQHLITQLKFRLNEGNGTAIYRLGVDDNGTVNGLSPSDLALSIDTLLYMASTLKAKLHLIRQRIIDKRRALEVYVKQLPPSNKGNSDLFVAMLGAIDVGKTTLLGVLSTGELDNGFGQARLNLFHHRHEVQTGRTSSCSSALLGFDKDNRTVNYYVQNDTLKKRSPNEIDYLSDRLITLFDLAGHPKYQKTTLAGLTRCQPSFVIIVVSATSYYSDNKTLETNLDNSAISSKQLLDYVRLVILLGIKFCIIISKVDRVPQEKIEEIRQRVKDQLVEISQTLPHKYLRNFDWPPTIFTVSAVTGVGLESLTDALSLLGKEDKYHSIDNRDSLQKLISSIPKHPSYPNVKFLVTKVFSNVSGVSGPIIVGNLVTGSIFEGQQLWLGPDQSGRFHLIDVIGIHRNRQPHELILAGQRASIAIQLSDRILGKEDSSLPSKTMDGFNFGSILLPRRGMIAISKHPHVKDTPFTDETNTKNAKKKPKIKCGVCWKIAVNRLNLLEFPTKNEGQLNLIPPLVSLSVKIFCNNVCQAGIISTPTGLPESNIISSQMREKGMLHIRFTKQPEFLEVGQQIIISWSPSSTKAVGYIASLEDVLSHFPCPPNSQICQDRPCSWELSRSLKDPIQAQEKTQMSDINDLTMKHRICFTGGEKLWKNLQSSTCSLLQMIGLDQSDIDNDHDIRVTYKRSRINYHNNTKNHKKESEFKGPDLIFSARTKSAIFTADVLDMDQDESGDITTEMSTDPSPTNPLPPSSNELSNSFDSRGEEKPKKTKPRRRNHKRRKKETL